MISAAGNMCDANGKRDVISLIGVTSTAEEVDLFHLAYTPALVPRVIALAMLPVRTGDRGIIDVRDIRVDLAGDLESPQSTVAIAQYVDRQGMVTCELST